MPTRQWLAPFLTLALTFGGNAYAGNISNLGTISQAGFQGLTQDLGMVLSYKDMMPASPLGITGFDVGVTGTDTRLANAQAWHDVTGSNSNNVFLPSIQVQKGLPLGFGVGVAYSAIPGSNVHVVGGDLSYAIIGGGLVAPALTIRGTYTKMTGVSEMDLNTRSVELCLSKGFVFITPYIGVGRVRTVGTPHVSGSSLSAVNLYNTKGYVGADINLGLMNLDLEVDRMAGSTSYGVNVGWRL
ncbi:MAG TPA: hypothetical protein VMV40_10270 [Acidiferrobacter sp.]|nr:hypothetical protein [Acidiferrobacter sp.]